MTEIEKRPPGRPPKPKGAMVTYIPQKNDPAEVTWNGYEFQANKATHVSHEGMISQAKNNPWFKVEGHDPAKSVQVDENPTDSDGYRRHAIALFNAAKSSQELKSRWEAEEGLRADCGVGTDDLEYLDKLYVPRLAQLEKAES